MKVPRRSHLRDANSLQSLSLKEFFKGHLFDSASLGLLPFLTLKRSRLGINDPLYNIYYVYGSYVHLTLAN